MRKYNNIQKNNEDLVKKSLNTLIETNTSVEDYRHAFYVLGQELGKVLLDSYGQMEPSHVMLVCASEDADWLAAGVENGFGIGELKKSVYWSTREVIFEEENGNKVEISPIVKAYEEPIDHCNLLVVVKSIINTSCVVKTQLTRLIGSIQPDHIAILAPVMFKDGIPNLKKEFPEQIASKFKFFYFAEDDECCGSIVIPGVGGSVYDRLGLGNIEEKNRYIPQTILDKL